MSPYAKSQLTLYLIRGAYIWDYTGERNIPEPDEDEEIEL